MLYTCTKQCYNVGVNKKEVYMEYSLSQCARDVVNVLRDESRQGCTYRGKQIDSLIRSRYRAMNGFPTRAMDSTTLRLFRKFKEEDNEGARLAVRYGFVGDDANAQYECDLVSTKYGWWDKVNKEYYSLECIDREKSIFAFVSKAV